MTSLRGAIKRLSLKPGDIILCKDRRLTDDLSRINIPGLDGTYIVEVDSFDDIRTVNLKNIVDKMVAKELAK